MASLKSELETNPRTWTHNSGSDGDGSEYKYTISTSPSRIPIAELNAMLGSKDLYWALALPEPVLLESLRNSICFGMYHHPDSSSSAAVDPENTAITEPTPTTTAEEFMGFGRCITDFVTFVYLTDVYVRPEHQGRGLGKWLVRCVKEVVDSMPHLRRTVLLTSDWERSVPFYESVLGMQVMDGRRNADGKGGVGQAVLTRKGPGAAF